MSDLIESMRRHVASYKMLTMHRMQCLELCDEVERLTQLDEDHAALAVTALKYANDRIKVLETELMTEVGKKINRQETIANLMARNKVLENVLVYCEQLTDCRQPEHTSRDVWNKWLIQKDAIAAADKCNHEIDEGDAYNFRKGECLLCGDLVTLDCSCGESTCVDCTNAAADKEDV